MPSMNGMLSMGRDLEQDGHSGKRQKTSDSEDELGTFSARQAAPSVRPVQPSAMDNGAPAEAGMSGRVSPKPSSCYREGTREPAITHRGQDSKQKGIHTTAGTVDVKDACLMCSDPATSLSWGTVNQLREPVRIASAAKMASPTERSAESFSGGPPVATINPQSMPHG